jgi:hypothetical protein
MLRSVAVSCNIRISGARSGLRSTIKEVDIDAIAAIGTVLEEISVPFTS